MMAGVINTLAGGGSLLTLPVLIFMGLPPNVANATNRIGIAFQALIGTAGYRSKGVSNFPFNIYLGISALMGSLIGAQIAVDIKGETFNKVLAVIMIIVVAIIVFKPKVSSLELPRNRSSISKAVGALFNPADFLYNLFGKNPAQMRKLKKMRADDEIKNLLASKFDREVLIQLLGIDRVNLEEILRNCNYSKAFIREANDLQILEAISGCYEEFKILQL